MADIDPELIRRQEGKSRRRGSTPLQRAQPGGSAVVSNNRDSRTPLADWRATFPVAQPPGTPVQSSTEADAFKAASPTPNVGPSFVPPQGNQAPEYKTTTVLASRAPNPFSYASGRGTPAQAEAWQKANSGNISTQRIDPLAQVANNMPIDVNSPAIQRELDAANGAVSTTPQQAAAIGNKFRTPGTPMQTVSVPASRLPSAALNPTASNAATAIPKGTAAAMPRQLSAAPENPNWQEDAMRANPNIRIAGHPDNLAFIQQFWERGGNPNLATALANEQTAARQPAPEEVTATQTASATEPLGPPRPPEPLPPSPPKPMTAAIIPPAAPPAGWNTPVKPGPFSIFERIYNSATKPGSPTKQTPPQRPSQAANRVNPYS